MFLIVDDAARRRHTLKYLGAERGAAALLQRADVDVARGVRSGRRRAEGEEDGQVAHDTHESTHPIRDNSARARTY